jgi:tetratricopeptide (TPR) repeat protein
MNRTRTLQALLILVVVVLLALFDAWMDARLWRVQTAHDQNNQGLAALDAEDLPQAHQRIGKAISLDDRFTPSLYPLAVAYEQDGRHDEAIRLYEQILGYDPWFVHAHINLGRIYLQTGNPREAQTILESGLPALRQNHPMLDKDVPYEKYQIYTYLGQAMYEQGGYALATQYLKEATDTGEAANFYYTYPYYYLALTLEAQNAPTDELINAWEHVLAFWLSDEPEQWADTARERLAVLRN